VNETKQNIDILIGKLLSGNISLEEKKELDAWIHFSPENEKQYRKSRKAWELSKNYVSTEKIAADKSSIQEEVKKQQTLKIKRTHRFLQFYRIAAILAIPVTFAISWLLFTQNNQTIEEVNISQFSAPKGHIAVCILPDSSQVWINTGSTISYNTNSFNHQNREIKLSGEAYFEVTKNKNKPFKVVTSLANINVTGTSFNVKAYPDTGDFQTVLSEGSIEMELNNENHQKVNLIPGEKAIFKIEEKEILVEKVDADFYTSWRNGKILFKDATLNDLIQELERIYDIHFNLEDPALGETRFRGMFSYDNNLIDALEKIKQTASINYYIKNKEVWLSRE